MSVLQISMAQHLCLLLDHSGHLEVVVSSVCGVGQAKGIHTSKNDDIVSRHIGKLIRMFIVLLSW